MSNSPIQDMAASIVINAATVAADAPSFAGKLESALSGVQLAKGIVAGYVDTVNEKGMNALKSTSTVLEAASQAVQTIIADAAVNTEKGIPVERTAFAMINIMADMLANPAKADETPEADKEAPKPQAPKSRANAA